MVSRFVRKVRTKSGAVAVQVVTRQGRQVLGIEHVGSAHTDEDLALLVAAARDRLLRGQAALDLGEVDAVPARMAGVADWTLPAGGLPSPARATRARAGGRPEGRVVATSSLLLWRVLTDAYSHLGFDVLGDEAFRAMVLARIVEPASKADSLRVLGEIGAPAPSLRTLFRLCVPKTSSTSCDQAIFVDQATDARPSSNAVLTEIDRPRERFQRRGAVQGAMRPMLVMVAVVLAQDPPQMSLVPDEGSVQQLAPASSNPAFGDRVHTGRPDIAEHGPDAGVGEDRLKRGGEVRSAVTDHELDLVRFLAEVHDQVAGRRPGCRRAGRP